MYNCLVVEYLMIINLRSCYDGSDGLMDKVSASQLQDHGFEPHKGHDHDSSYDTSTGWF